MTQFASDTFTDGDNTVLSSHTPDVPGTGVWSLIHGNASSALILSNTVSTDNTLSLWAHPATTPSADYSVSADLHITATGGGSGIAARINTSNGECYAFGYNLNGDTKWDLFYINWTANTRIGSATATVSNGNTYRLKLQCSATAITCYVDGAQVISVTDSTISAKGSAGLTPYKTDSFNTLDNFSADTITSAAGTKQLLMLGAG